MEMIQPASQLLHEAILPSLSLLSLPTVATISSWKAKSILSRLRDREEGGERLQHASFF